MVAETSTSMVRRFQNMASKGLENTKEALEVHSTLTTVARAIAEIFATISKVALVATQVLLPFRAISLLTTPFKFVSVGKNTKDAILAPGKLKAYPIMNAVSAVGDVLDSASSAISIANAIGLPGVQAAAIAIGPLAAAAGVLNLFGIGATAWAWSETNKKWRTVENLLQTNSEPALNQYKDAVEFLTRKPVTLKEKFKEAFFGFLQDDHKEALLEIFKRCSESRLPSSSLTQAFSEIKRHVTWKNVQYALSIALLIIGIVGVMCLVFSPTPAALILLPLGWGLLGGSCLAGLAVAGTNYYQNYRLKRALRKQFEEI